MTDEPVPASPLHLKNNRANRLDSWKDIAAYLKRDVSTVQRWEKRERMPVHRHVHDKLGSVYAFRPELDAWWHGRGGRLTGQEPSGPVQESAPASTGRGDDGLRAALAGCCCRSHSWLRRHSPAFRVAGHSDGCQRATQRLRAQPRQRDQSIRRLTIYCVRARYLSVRTTR